MRNKFGYITLFFALLVAGTSGLFSIYGLSQLFYGASTAVIIMGIVLEAGKIVSTTALHRYWGRISKWLRTYLTISVVILMLITSAGIYGFLSNAYQKTANKLEIQDGQVSLLDNKKILFQKSIDANENVIKTKNKRIEQLTDLRTKQENRLDGEKTNWEKDRVRTDIVTATTEIQKLSADIDILNTKNSILSDSIGKYNTKTLDLNESNQVAGEVGPLKYIAQLTGLPMGKVVNILILLLIFVFDPLAVALILMTNRIFEIEKQSPSQHIQEDVYNEPITPKLDIIEPEIERNTVEDIPESPIQENTPLPIERPIIEEPLPLQPPKKEPIIPNGKIQLEDIKEVKDRGYSVKVPEPKSNNAIERIGSNKVVKNGENKKMFYKR